MVVDCIIKLNQGHCLTSENYVGIQIRFKVYCTHKCGHFLRVAPAHKIGQATI